MSEEVCKGSLFFRICDWVWSDYTATMFRTSLSYLLEGSVCKITIPNSNAIKIIIRCQQMQIHSCCVPVPLFFTVQEYWNMQHLNIGWLLDAEKANLLHSQCLIHSTAFVVTAHSIRLLLNCTADVPSSCFWCHFQSLAVSIHQETSSESCGWR